MGKVKNIGMVTVASQMISGNSKESVIEGIVSECLCVMPPGTRHIGTELKPIDDLSIPFEMTFEHPVLHDGDRIELQYHREFYKHPNKNEGVNCNVLTGFKYVKPDGEPRYK